jgi:hypothetical protein
MVCDALGIFLFQTWSRSLGMCNKLHVRLTKQSDASFDMWMIGVQCYLLTLGDNRFLVCNVVFVTCAHEFQIYELARKKVSSSMAVVLHANVRYLMFSSEPLAEFVRVLVHDICFTGTRFTAVDKEILRSS